jgi:exodeoxyribonuclease-5
VHRIFGYAGTGKTTLARKLAEGVNTVIFAAYTGKAAHVLKTKGCKNTTTIHSLIYLPKSKSKEILDELIKKYERIESTATKEELDLLQKRIDKERERIKDPSFSLNYDSELKSADLLVVDEVSMVDQIVGMDLLSFNTKILVLGDPGQLPPVKGAGFFMDTEPDSLLTEIHRQAHGSPILKLATQVREGARRTDTDLIVPKGTLSIGDLAKADQILCGLNKTRGVINARMREHLGMEGQYPVVNDRLICLRNDHEAGLLNGGQWRVDGVSLNEETDKLHLTLSCVDTQKGVTCKAHAAPFRGEEVPYYEIRDAQMFDFAYAMTVHKSQGSQWEKVILIDESSRFPFAQRRKWLYTGITRAAENLTLIR